MRCISPIAEYAIQVFEGEEDIVRDARGHAKTVTLRKPVIANFYPSGLLVHEQEIALEKFNFTGLPDGVHPLTRVGVFDSETYAEANFKPAERAERLREMDERLRELSERHPSEFLCVDQPKAPKPWPSYDDVKTVKEILKLREQTGIEPEAVRLYEGENANRPEVIEAMWRLQDPEYADQLYGPDGAEMVAEVGA